MVYRILAIGAVTAMALVMVIGSAGAGERLGVLRDGDGKRIGTIERNTLRPERQFDVYNRDGRRILTIERNGLRPERQFDIFNRDRERVGTIERDSLSDDSFWYGDGSSEDSIWYQED